MQLQVEDCLSLDLAEGKRRDQSFASGLWVWRSADERNHFIQVIQCNDQAFQDMRSRFRFLEVEFRPAMHDFPAMRNEMLENLPEVEYVGSSVNDRKKYDAKAVMHAAVLVQIVQNHFGIFAAAELNHNPHSLPVRFIAQIGDSFDAFVANQIGNFFYELGFVDLVRNFMNDDRFLLALFYFFNRCLRTHLDRPSTGFVGGGDVGF